MASSRMDPRMLRRSLVHGTVGMDDDGMLVFVNNNATNDEGTNHQAAAGVSSSNHINAYQQQPQVQHHHNDINNNNNTQWDFGDYSVEFLATVAVWLFVAVGTIYFLVTERKRQVASRRMQRQQRLEYFTPTQQQQRRNELMAVLQPTTLVVQEKDLVVMNDQEEEGPSAETIVEESSRELLQNESPENNPHHDLESGWINSPQDETASMIVSGAFRGDDDDDDDDDDDAQSHCLKDSSNDTAAILHQYPSPDTNDPSDSDDDDDNEDQWQLCLPHSTPTTVSATCAICLRRYRVHDPVTWSPHAPTCPHVFHQACLVEWLAKLPDCNCPCCRHVFCSPTGGVDAYLKSTRNDHVRHQPRQQPSPWSAFFASER